MNSDINSPLAERVIATIARAQDIPVETVTPESTFEELGIDSLQGLHVVFELESEFGIEIPNERALQINTVRDAIDNIADLVTASQSSGAGQ